MTEQREEPEPPPAEGEAADPPDTTRGESRLCAGVALDAGGSDANGAGRIDTTPIRDAVRGNAADLQRCYEAVLARDRSAEGRASYTWIIARDGRVAYVELADASVALSTHDDFSECMFDEICTWQFRAPGGGTVRVTYPFRFAPATAAP